MTTLQKGPLNFLGLTLVEGLLPMAFTMSRPKSFELSVRNRRAEYDSNCVLTKPTLPIVYVAISCHAIAQLHAKNRALGNRRGFDCLSEISPHLAEPCIRLS